MGEVFNVRLDKNDVITACFLHGAMEMQDPRLAVLYQDSKDNRLVIYFNLGMDPYNL